MPFTTDTTILEVPNNLPAWRVDEIERLRSQIDDDAEAYTKDGVRYWRSNDHVIPVFVYQDAYLVAPPQHVKAYDDETEVFMKEYREARQNMTAEQRAEEAFEMRVAFGPGVEVVNVLTGERTRT